MKIFHLFPVLCILFLFGGCKHFEPASEEQKPLKAQLESSIAGATQDVSGAAWNIKEHLPFKAEPWFDIFVANEVDFITSYTGLPLEDTKTAATERFDFVGKNYKKDNTLPIGAFYMTHKKKAEVSNQTIKTLLSKVGDDIADKTRAEEEAKRKMFLTRVCVYSAITIAVFSAILIGLGMKLGFGGTFGAVGLVIASFIGAFPFVLDISWFLPVMGGCLIITLITGLWGVWFHKSKDSAKDAKINELEEHILTITKGLSGASSGAVETITGITEKAEGVVMKLIGEVEKKVS